MEKDTRNFYIHMVIVASITIIFDVYFELAEEEDILKAAEKYSLTIFYILVGIRVFIYLILEVHKLLRVNLEEGKNAKKFSMRFFSDLAGSSNALFFDLWSFWVIAVFFWGYGGAFVDDYEITVFWVRYSAYGVIPLLTIMGYLARNKKL